MKGASPDYLDMENTDHKKDALPKRENPWLNLGFNILIPILLLSKGDDWFGFSPTANLIIALAFPLGYGVVDLVMRKKFNLFSILGFVSVLLTGGIGLLKLPNEWIAIKEAAIPLLLGIAVAVSLYTPFPLVKKLLLNPEMVDLPKIEAKIKENRSEKKFQALISSSSWLVVASFLVSAVLNYVLARVVVTSPAGTPEFNEQLGRMQGLSYIVIFVPSMAILLIALFRLFSGIQRLTGLEWETFIRGAKPPEKSGS